LRLGLGGTLYNKPHYLTLVNVLTYNEQYLLQCLLISDKVSSQKYSCSLFVHVSSQCIDFNIILVNVEVKGIVHFEINF